MRYRIDTGIGPMDLEPTSAGRIVVSAGRGPEGHADHVSVNGVRYYVRADLYQWSDGAWCWGPEYDEPRYRGQEPSRRNPDSTYGYLHTTRETWTDARHMDATPAAYRRIRDAIRAAVNEWATAFPEHLRGAQVEELIRQHNAATTRAATAHKEYEQAMEDARAIMEQLAALESAAEVSPA